MRDAQKQYSDRECRMPKQKRADLPVPLHVSSLPIRLGLLCVTMFVSLSFLGRPALAVPEEMLDPGSRLAPIIVGGKYGYAENSGKVVIPPRFDDARAFTFNNRAAVRVDGKWGYVDSTGALVIAPAFAEADDFGFFDVSEGCAVQGLAWVRVGDTWGAVDASGAMIIKPVFDKAGKFAFNGLAPVLSGGKWGYVDTQGRMVAKPAFDEAGGFSPYGPARVKINNAYGYTAGGGEPVIKPTFVDAGEFTGHGPARVKVDGKYGYIDAKGDLVIKPVYTDVGDFSACGLAPVRVDNGSSPALYGYIDTKGEMIIKPTFEYARAFTEPARLAVVRIDGKYGYVNDRGEIAVKPIFAAAEDFTGNGMARVKPAGSGAFAFIAADGNIVLREDTANGVPVLKNGVGAIVWPDELAERAPTSTTAEPAQAEGQLPWTGPGLFKRDLTVDPKNLPAPGPAPEHCERGDFERFFTAFSEDVDRQYASTAFPLVVIVESEAQDRPAGDFNPLTMVVRKDDSGAPSVPIFPPAKQRESTELRYKTTPQFDGGMVVTLYKEHTDTLVEYIFTWNNCWRLTTIHDRSL